MAKNRNKLEEYRETGHYYIPTETYDLLWIDEVGRWTMNASAINMRSCMELDRIAQELDEKGYEIILMEFGIETDYYELEKIRFMNPLEVANFKSVK